MILAASDKCVGYSRKTITGVSRGSDSGIVPGKGGLLGRIFESRSPGGVGARIVLDFMPWHQGQGRGLAQNMGEIIMTRYLYAMTLVIVGALALPPAGSASEKEKEGEEENESHPQLSEIIVTATRRETDLEKTPVAVTAFSAADIASQRIYNVSDIASKVPGLVFLSPDHDESYLSIRGTTVGNDAAGANLGVSMFIDDVPTTGVGDNSPDLFDLQSIEVLRGPQGTLFGQNVTGGAVIIHTLTPSFTPHASVQATYGAYNLGELRAYFTGPITDQLAGKLTFQGRRQDGYLNNVYLHDHTPDTHDGAVRGQLLWEPGQNWRILFGIEYRNDTSSPRVTQIIANFQPSLFPSLSYNPNDTNQAINATGRQRSGNAIAKIEYDASFGTLTSISGYRHVGNHGFHSTDGSPFDTLPQMTNSADTQYTQEFRVTSNTDQRLIWVGGLFGLVSSRNNFSTYYPNLLPDSLVALFGGPPYSALTFTSSTNQTIEWHSYAAFGEASYQISDPLKVTVGGRYTREYKGGNSQFFVVPSGLVPDLLTPSYSHSWSDFTPKVSLSFQPTDVFLAYATFSEGFKSGGYDTSGASASGSVAALETPFKQETVKSYELGGKLVALDKRLDLNVAAFYADYTDLQVNEYNPALLQSVTANAGRAKIPGVEIEINSLPTNWLSVKAGYSFMNAVYADYVIPADNQGNPAVSFNGHQIPFAAKHHANLSAEIHLPSPYFGGEVRFGGDVTYQSKRYFTDQNDDADFVTKNTVIRQMLNVHATWTSADEAWSVMLWGKNVNNTHTLTAVTNVNPFFMGVADAGGTNSNLYVGNYTAPAFYGITVTYKH